MNKFINIYDIAKVLKINGYKWDGTMQTQNGQVIVSDVNDFCSYKPELSANGIFTKLTDKTNQKHNCNIYIDNYLFLIYFNKLDFFDPRYSQAIFDDVTDLSKQWIEYLANKYPQYIETAKTELHKQELLLINKYLKSYENNTTDKVSKKISLKVYKDGISKLNENLQIIDNIAKKIKER